MIRRTDGVVCWSSRPASRVPGLGGIGDRLGAFAAQSFPAVVSFVLSVIQGDAELTAEDRALAEAELKRASEGTQKYVAALKAELARGAKARAAADAKLSATQAEEAAYQDLVGNVSFWAGEAWDVIKAYLPAFVVTRVESAVDAWDEFKAGAANFGYFAAGAASMGVIVLFVLVGMWLMTKMVATAAVSSVHEAAF